MTEPATSDPLVCIYTSPNQAEFLVVESLLRAAGIQFMVKGEMLQGLIGAGQIGGNNIAVPLEIHVLERDAAAALKLLQQGRQSRRVGNRHHHSLA